MNTKTYEQTRSELTPERLAEYDGKWVAFSGDGKRIIATSNSLAELDRLVILAGEDAEQVGYERIELRDSSVGGAELM